jgi:4-amino-4-deoxy-L-arabinose transferase-like glycosyltransferase
MIDPEPSGVSLTRRQRAVAVAGMLVLHAGLLGFGGWYHSPTWDEPGHLASGVSHWRTGCFDLYRVNPPLVRMAAALPVLASRADLSWVEEHAFSPDRRREWVAGYHLIEANGERAFWYVTLARWTCIPLSLLGAIVCYWWARELFGDAAGLIGMGLWCVSPNILGHGQLLTPDVGATAIGLAAFYVYRHWLKTPTWRRAALCGVVFGMALLAKTTWIILFGLWPALWFVWRWPELGGRHLREWRRQGTQLAGTLLIGVYVLNLGYGFEGTGQLLGKYPFFSNALSGRDSDNDTPRDRGNRFEDTWLGAVPVPLPVNYVRGIDRQKRDFENGLMSYLRGEWQRGGWWYYYLYALAIKVPLGIWLLLALAGGAAFLRRDYRASWQEELMLLVPVIVVLTLVSSQTGFNHHLRYVLPIFPFASIWMSRVALAVPRRHWRLAGVGAVALGWSLGSSLYCYPHSLSYFNEVVGGPRHGHDHLLNSNVDWGQDLLVLKRWMDRHPEARPMALAYMISPGVVDPADVGIEYTLPPVGPNAKSRRGQEQKLGPLPGWYAISVSRMRSHDRKYDYFRRFDPVAMMGYSMYIYHITLEPANRARAEMGLPELSDTGFDQHTSERKTGDAP